MTTWLYSLLGFAIGFLMSWMYFRNQILRSQGDLQTRLSIKEHELLALQGQADSQNQQLKDQVQQLVAEKTETALLQEKVLSQREAIFKEQMSQQFEILAQKILDDKTSKVTTAQTTQLHQLLEPFKERLKDFEKKVDETYTQERADRGSLKGEISKMMDLNIKMSTEASHLTRALQGDVKSQGLWGEMILESILEKSGLREGEEFTLQGLSEQLKNDDGQVIKPDVIIHMPEQKHIIIDSKVSLTAYQAYVDAATPEEQDRQGRMHVESLKKHIDSLSAKKYFTADKLLSPDFVILFMPLEPAFALAFKMKPDLLQYAWDKNIALVSPTTLLTTLKTVATLWKHEKQERNALEIAKRGGALYEKFVAMVDDFRDVGDKMALAQKAQERVMSKMSEGTGNLIRQVEMLKELGVKTEKKLVSSKSTKENTPLLQNENS